MSESVPNTPLSSKPPDDRLDSWKEIAAYLKRDVTTVQRWEKREGMPVHRHVHDRLGSVYASRTALDAWARSRTPLAGEAANNSGSDSQTTSIWPATGAGHRFSRFRIAILAGLIIVIALVAVSLSLRRTQEIPFGTTRTTKLTGDGQEFKATISPDGRYIAHTLLAAGLESLRVRRSTTLHDIEVVSPQPVRYIGITFSPDSETIYYVVRTEKAEPTSLYRIGLMGGTPEKLKERLDSPVTFSPDGKRFAFVRESAVESTLIVADLKAGSEESLISRKLPRVLDYPAWSPDGQSIAFTDSDSSASSAKGSDTRIVKVQIKNREEQPISSHAWGYVRQLSWLGNGQGLVMSARDQAESGTFHVWYVSFPDGFERKVTDGLNSQMGASISGDSHQIVTVEESNFSTSIWRVGLIHPQDPVPIVPGSSGWSAPVWTHDGRIVFEEDLEGRRSIWTVGADGANRKQLSLIGNNYDHSISRNGKKIAWVSDRDGSPGIWTMDMDGGNLVKAVKASGESVPQLSPNGKWIVFTALGTEHWPTLWKVAPGEGPATELNKELWQRPVISPDGKWIAGFYADRQLSTQKFPEEIAIIAIDADKPQKVFPIPLSVFLTAGIRWSRDSREVTFVKRGKDGDNIWAFRLSDGAQRQITRLHGIEVFSFDWSPDGSQLALSRGVQTKDVILVEDKARSKQSSTLED